jgi:hypothetical protein
MSLSVGGFTLGALASMQVLDFSRSVLEDLSNFDVSGAWPVLLDEFVESLQACYWPRFSPSVACGPSAGPPNVVTSVFVSWQHVHTPSVNVHIHSQTEPCPVQVQRARPSTLSSRPEPRPSPWTLLSPGSGETPGSDGVALAGVSPVAGRSASLTRGPSAAHLFSCHHALGRMAIPSDALWMVHSKRRQLDVDGLTSRLEAARLANMSPHKGGLGSSGLRSSEELIQPLKRQHFISSPG